MIEEFHGECCTGRGALWRRWSPGANAEGLPKGRKAVLETDDPTGGAARGAIIGKAMEQPAIGRGLVFARHAAVTASGDLPNLLVHTPSVRNVPASLVRSTVRVAARPRAQTAASLLRLGRQTGAQQAERGGWGSSTNRQDPDVGGVIDAMTDQRFEA